MHRSLCKVIFHQPLGKNEVHKSGSGFEENPSHFAWNPDESIQISIYSIFAAIGTRNISGPPFCQENFSLSIFSNSFGGQDATIYPFQLLQCGILLRDHWQSRPNLAQISSILPSEHLNPLHLSSNVENNTGKLYQCSILECHTERGCTLGVQAWNRTLVSSNIPL